MRKKTAASVILLTVSASVLMLSYLSQSISSFFRKISALLAHGISFVTSTVSFPISEFFIILVPLIALIGLIYGAVKGGLRGFSRSLTSVFLCICILITAFSFILGVNYTAPSLAKQLGLHPAKASYEQLYSTVVRLAVKVNEYSILLDRNADGTLVGEPYASVCKNVSDAYSKISEKYEIYSGSAAYPKQAGFLSVPMSYFGIAGYYFPFSAESVVSKDTVKTGVPFHVSHETAHALGIAKEDEANFSAFLSCISSDDALTAYSGYFNAYIYASNALYDISSSDYYEIHSFLTDQAKKDLQILNVHSQKYDTPIRDIGEKINDAYIIGTGQPDGIRSYGNMVDLIIAYYAE